MIHPTVARVLEAALRPAEHFGEVMLSRPTAKLLLAHFKLDRDLPLPGYEVLLGETQEIDTRGWPHKVRWYLENRAVAFYLKAHWV